MRLQLLRSHRGLTRHIEKIIMILYFYFLFFYFYFVYFFIFFIFLFFLNFFIFLFFFYFFYFFFHFSFCFFFCMILLYCYGESGAKVTQHLCNRIWKTKRWPADWKNSTFLTLPKKVMSANAKTTEQLH